MRIDLTFFDLSFCEHGDSAIYIVTEICYRDNIRGIRLGLVGLPVLQVARMQRWQR